MNSNNWFYAVIVKMVLLMALLSSSASLARIVNGQVISSGPANANFQNLTPFTGQVGNDNQQSNNLLGFDEQQNVTLNTLLVVDILASTGTIGVVNPGTKVSSHYLFFDPANQQTIEGCVKFDKPVLAVITTGTELNVSDFYVTDPGITYHHAPGRSIEPATDSVWINNPGNGNNASKEVCMRLSANSPGDYIRVLTDASGNNGNGQGNANKTTVDKLSPVIDAKSCKGELVFVSNRTPQQFGTTSSVFYKNRANTSGRVIELPFSSAMYTEALSPSWSHNGKWIAFIGRLPGTPSLYSLEIVEKTNIGFVNVTHYPFSSIPYAAPEWSPDDKMLVLTTKDSNGAIQLFDFNHNTNTLNPSQRNHAGVNTPVLDSTNVSNFGSVELSRAFFSADNKWLYYIAETTSSQSIKRIAVINGVVGNVAQSVALPALGVKFDHVDLSANQSTFLYSDRTNYDIYSIFHSPSAAPVLQYAIPGKQRAWYTRNGTGDYTFESNATGRYNIWLNDSATQTVWDLAQEIGDPTNDFDDHSPRLWVPKYCKTIKPVDDDGLPGSN